MLPIGAEVSTANLKPGLFPQLNKFTGTGKNISKQPAHLNTFLTPAACILISRHMVFAPRFWKERSKPMNDLIYIAVMALFFVAGQLYARWCEKL